MLHRQQVEKLVEAAIRQVAGTIKLPEGTPVSPEATLVDFDLDSIDYADVELTIENESDRTIKFDNDNRILPTDSFSDIVSKAMICQYS